MERSNYGGHLHILEAEEIAHIYSLPDFTPDERAIFFSLSTQEREQLSKLRGIASKVYFILQLGYFKAKHLFFIFDFEDRVVDRVLSNKSRFCFIEVSLLIKSPLFISIPIKDYGDKEH